MFTALLLLGLLAQLHSHSVVRKLDENNFEEIRLAGKPSVVLLYHSEYTAEENRIAARGFSSACASSETFLAEYDCAYGNIKLLSNRSLGYVREGMNEYQIAERAPAMFLFQDGHVTKFDFDFFSSEEDMHGLFNRLIQQPNLVRYTDNKIEDEFIKNQFCASYKGPLKGQAYNRFILTAATFPEFPYYLDLREPLPKTPVITAHKFQNTEQYVYEPHISLLRTFLFTQKFTRTGGRLSFFDESTTMAMTYKANTPMLFLLCETNSCRTDIEKVNWVIDKYQFYFLPIYAFEEKIEEDEYVVKRLANEPKPAIFIMEVKNRAHHTYLLRDNVEEGAVRESFDEHHIEELVRKYLMNYGSMVEMKLSETEDYSKEYPLLTKITGDNYNKVIKQGGDDWMIIVHEATKEGQQAMHNFYSWVESYGKYFSKLRFGIYNQLINKLESSGYNLKADLLTNH